MHYRVTRLMHTEENQTKVKSYLESVKDEIESIDGLLSITLISLSKEETLGISKYESDEKMVTANPVQQKLLGGAAGLLSEPPIVESGDILWKWSR